MTDPPVRACVRAPTPLALLCFASAFAFGFGLWALGFACAAVALDM